MDYSRSACRFLFSICYLGICVLFNSAAWASSAFGSFYSKLREETLQNSYEIQILRSTADQKAAQNYTAWTRWFPRVDLQLIQSRAQDYSFVTSGALGMLGQNFRPEPLSLSRWELSSTLPLYRRSVFQGVTLALAEKRQAQVQLELKLSEVDWRLRTLAGSYLYEVYRLVALESAATLAKTTLNEAELSFNLGQKTKVDVLRAKANLVLMDSKKAGFDQARVAARNALFEYVGVSRERVKGLELDRPAGEPQVLEVVNGLIDLEKALIPVDPYLASETAELKVSQRLSEQSAVFRNLVLDEELAHTRAKAVMNTEWPELLLKGSLNKQAQDWNGAFSSGNQSYSAAVVLSIPM
ncbi:TolC family protein, partial [Bdellovibrionota bacterium FG-2]